MNDIEFITYTPIVKIGDNECETNIDSEGNMKIKIDGGCFDLLFEVENVGKSVMRLSQKLEYHGKTCKAVKIIARFSLPLFYPDLEYYTYAGRVWNGNKFGIKVHEFGDELREDRFSIPSGITLENKEYIIGIWAEPQKDIDDTLTSAVLKKNDTKKTYEIDISAPYTDIIPNRVNEDRRFVIEDGWRFEKNYYIYMGEIADLPGGVSGLKHGYAQVFNAAWDLLYPNSSTKPEMSLQKLCKIKLDNMLSEREGLLRKKKYNNKEYLIWYVAKDSGNIIHSYAGFSWSGYLGMTAYHAIKH